MIKDIITCGVGNTPESALEDLKKQTSAETEDLKENIEHDIKSILFSVGGYKSEVSFEDAQKKLETNGKKINSDTKYIVSVKMNIRTKK